MSKEPVSGLKPLNDCVLVELKQSFKNVHTKESKHETRTEGVVIAVPDPDSTTYFIQGPTEPGVVRNPYPQAYFKQLIGKRVHFEEFKEGARIKRDGKIYSFIKIEDIRGYEDV